MTNSTDNPSSSNPPAGEDDEVLELTEEVDAEEDVEPGAEAAGGESESSAGEAGGGPSEMPSSPGESTPGVRDTVPEVPDELEGAGGEKASESDEPSGVPEAAVVSTPDQVEGTETIPESEQVEALEGDEETPAVFQTIQMEAIDRTAIEREGQMRQLEETEPLEDGRFSPEIVVRPPRDLIEEWHEGLPHRSDEEVVAEADSGIEGEFPEGEPTDVATAPTEPAGHEAAATEVSGEVAKVEEPADEEPTDPEVSPEEVEAEAVGGETTQPQGEEVAEELDDDEIPVVEPDEDDAVEEIEEVDEVEEVEEVEPEPADESDEGVPHAAMPTPPPEARKGSGGQGSELVEELVDEEGGEQPARGEWVQEVFGQLYLSTVPSGIRARTSREADFIESQLTLEATDKVLDLACGYGRHTVELNDRGFEVVGFDLSKPLLKQGLAEAKRRSLKINFFHGDMRSLEFENVFDACFCWQTSFGYFDDRTNLDVLARVNRALTSGGEVLLEVMNRDYVVKKMPHRIWWEGPECIFLEEGEFDYETSILHMNRSFIYEDGSRQPVEHDWEIRLYSPHELKRLFEQTGFEFVELSGSIHYPGYFLGHDSPKQIIHARKRRSVA